MKKHRLLAALIAGTMIFTPMDSEFNPLITTASANEETLPAPTNYKAEKTDVSITLSWDAVSGADGYRVYIYNEYSRKYEKYKNVLKNSCKITNLYANTKYKFKVATLVKSGEKLVEQNSSKVSATTEATKLPAPTNYSASATEDSITLSWDIVWGADAYRVYKYNETKKEYEQYKNVSGNKCKVAGLSTNTQYKFKVAALVKSGNKLVEQKSSTVKAKTTEHLLAAPANKAVTSTTSSSISLKWDAVTGASAYRIYIQYPYSYSYEIYQNVASTTCNIKDLNSDTTYYFKLAALVENDNRYKEQTQTKAFAVKTKVETTSYSGGSSGGVYSGGGSSIPAGSKYVLNTNTLKIHEPSCRWVKQIHSENYATTDDFDWAISHGYSTCAVCNPRKY